MIRRATPADAPAIAAIEVRGWHHAFADIIEPERMPTVEDREPRFVGTLAGGAEMYVFDQDGQVAGFVAVDGDELRAIYVDPPAQGAGVGAALLEVAAEAMGAAGHAEAFLWTFEASGLARAFYERHGWQDDGGRRERVPGQPEVRYRSTL